MERSAACTMPVYSAATGRGAEGPADDEASAAGGGEGVSDGAHADNAKSSTDERGIIRRMERIAEGRGASRCSILEDSALSPSPRAMPLTDQARKRAAYMTIADATRVAAATAIKSSGSSQSTCEWRKEGVDERIE